MLSSNRDDILLEFNLDLLQRGVPAGRFEPFLRPGARSFPRSNSPFGCKNRGPSALECFTPILNPHFVTLFILCRGETLALGVSAWGKP